MFKSRRNLPIPCFVACVIAASCSLWKADSLHAAVETRKDPAIEEVRSKVRAYSRVSTHPAHRAAREKIIAEMKAWGPRSRIQELLAGFYPGADKEERLAILYIFNFHTLKEAGCESALEALPAIAGDFAKARPHHPNATSFQGFYVLEQFMQFGWRKLPAHASQQKVLKRMVNLEPGSGIAQVQSPRSSADGLVNVGALEDRKTIVEIIVEKQLHRKRPHNQDYLLPGANETDWIRVIGEHAFVRLRGESSGTDYIFIRRGRGEWALLISMGDWIN